MKGNDKWQIIETILFALGALITAAKYIIKFIDYLGKLRARRKPMSRSFAY